MSALLDSMFQKDASSSAYLSGRALRALAASTVLALVACSESSVGPTQASSTMELPPLAAALVGASTRGVDNFHFLPPIAPKQKFTGTFDADLAPVVEICVLDSDDECQSIVETFTTAPASGSETIHVDSDEEHYLVKWHTRGLGPGDYRISVRVDGCELGHTDVAVVANRRDVGVRRVGVKSGRTLPIKFRIEEIEEQAPTVWDALISHWPADGTPVDVVGDSDGAWVGADMYGVGIAGQAFSFDPAAGARVEAPFNRTGDFTLALWAKTDDPKQTAFTGVFASSDARPESNSPTFQVDLDGAGNYRVQVGQIEEVSLGAITPGVFQHIAVTWDGTTVRTYLNGSSVDSFDFTLTIDLARFGTNRGGGLSFSGLVDEVQIFDDALTEVEIQEICNAISIVCGS